jgi:hypothetical protein
MVLPFSATFPLCIIPPSFSITFPVVESYASKLCRHPTVINLPSFSELKLPVLFPYPAPPVDPLPYVCALLYGAVSLCTPNRNSSGEADGDDIEECLFPN